MKVKKDGSSILGSGKFDPANEWVTLELSYLGESATPAEIIKSIRQLMSPNEVDIFVPSVVFSRLDNCLVITVLEGYAFIRGGLNPSDYFDSEASPYIQRVLSHGDSGERFVSYVPNSVIAGLREELQSLTNTEMDVGDVVLVMEGHYSKLRGVVVGFSEDKTSAYVDIERLLSLNTYVELPLQFLFVNPSPETGTSYTLPSRA